MLVHFSLPNEFRRFFPFMLLATLSCGVDRANAASPQESTAEASAQTLAVRGHADLWVPPDIDRVIPEITPGAKCALGDVLSGVGKRIQELVQNVDKFTASEAVEHQNVSASGRLGPAETHKFNYLVSITRAPNGTLNVQEFRDGGLGEFPDHIATLGTPALALIFHPRYVDNFSMTCEGLGQWRGQTAWQVHFEERENNNSISTMRIGGHIFNLRLRGRAWILADSYQVARLETDLAKEISQIQLRLQHQIIEYRSMPLTEGRGEIWLPASTELYMDFRGHRFYRQHTLTDIQFFSVRVQQTFGDPTKQRPRVGSQAKSR
jgi:hypothetical protein